MFYFRQVLFISLAVAFAVLAKGQDPYYTSINKLSGLPSNTIYDIFQDSKGFIWIANNEGLTRYDGFEFTTYIHSSQTSRSGNQVREDKYGRIWYKNFDGYLYYVHNDSLQPLNQHTPIGNTEYAILNDRLLVLQREGVDYYDLKTLQFSIARQKELLLTAGAQKVWVDESSLESTAFSVHLMGTCRMGDDPKSSVVNRWNRTHEVPNLYLVDGSSLVTSGRQQPTATIQALAYRTADHLRESAKRGEL